MNICEINILLLYCLTFVMYVPCFKNKISPIVELVNYINKDIAEI